MPDYLEPSEAGYVMALEEMEKSIPEMLADETGEPVERFEYDPEEYPIPELDDLESVDPEDVYE